MFAKKHCIDDIRDWVPPLISTNLECSPSSELYHVQYNVGFKISGGLTIFESIIVNNSVLKLSSSRRQCTNNTH